MSSYKKTLPLVCVVLVLLVLGMVAFAELDDMSYENAYGLCVQTMTTVGYGNNPPKTDGAKIFFLFYSTITIPLNILLLQLLGEHMLDGQKLLITTIERKLFKRVPPRYLNEKCSFMGVFMLWAFIAIGAGVVHHEENWSYLDGIYFYQVTFSTVGFGDMIPGVDANSALAKKILYPTFSYLGICAFANVLNGLAGCLETVRLIKRLLGCNRIRNGEAEKGTDVQDTGGDFIKSPTSPRLE